MLKYIIFDFDGTIVNSKKLALHLINELSGKYGYRKAGEEELEYLSTLSIRDRLKLFKVPFYKVPQIVLDMRKNYNHSVESLEIFSGIEELIHNLKEKGFRLGIISSNAGENIRKVLVKYNIDVFDSIHSSYNLFGKSGKINTFLKKHHLKKEEIIYIGDELRDVQACQKSTVAIIAVTWGYDASDLLRKANPDHMVNKPSEILDLIQSFQ
jgi:phosphoglycolate phosphatase